MSNQWSAPQPQPPQATGAAPAGWYPDPRGTGQPVYWDGAQWHWPTGGSPYGAQPTHTNGLAIASLILGIITLCGLGSLLAIVLGAAALAQIKHDPRETGKGLAIAGIILGALGLLVIVGLIAAAIAQANDPNNFTPFITTSLPGG